jgi:hypothetical protein
MIAPGAGEKQATPEIETELRVLLSETAAYRAYFRRADAGQLVRG